jgi:hypothetical protein
MSIKIRVFAATVAASLLLGSASFAISEPRQTRRVAVEESRGFWGEMFERVRELLGGRRASNDRTVATDSSLSQKEGTVADPNGGK